MFFCFFLLLLYVYFHHCCILDESFLTIVNDFRLVFLIFRCILLDDVLSSIIIFFFHYYLLEEYSFLIELFQFLSWGIVSIDIELLSEKWLRNDCCITTFWPVCNVPLSVDPGNTYRMVFRTEPVISRA